MKDYLRNLWAREGGSICAVLGLLAALFAIFNSVPR